VDYKEEIVAAVISEIGELRMRLLKMTEDQDQIVGKSMSEDQT
jgi:hypothetical protein